jgi:hypothetical protein
METIKVDFIKREQRFFKPTTYKRIRFDENYNVSMLPQKNSLIIIGGKKYSVFQLVYYPFGDAAGQIGVAVYLDELKDE